MAERTGRRRAAGERRSGGRRKGRDGSGLGCGEDRERGHHHERGNGHGSHGNPADLESYLARLEGEDRIAWQKPDEVVRALGLRPGDTACDIGVGPGYFAIRLARAVGPTGRVHAIDVEPRMIEVLRERLRAAGIGNVHPMLARAGKPALPPRRCDVILVVNTFHHFPDGAATLRALARRLAPGGRIVNVDFHEGELPVGPPPGHKISREDFIATAGKAGLEVAAEHAFLPYQYFLALRPATGARKARAAGSGGKARPPRSAARGAGRVRGTRSRAPRRA